MQSHPLSVLTPPLLIALQHAPYSISHRVVQSHTCGEWLCKKNARQRLCSRATGHSTLFYCHCLNLNPQSVANPTLTLTLTPF